MSHITTASRPAVKCQPYPVTVGRNHEG